MESREQQRARHFPGLARLLRAPDFRSAFTEITGETRSHTVVIALPDDTMGYVFARLREADYRGVVALAQEGPVKLAVIGPASPAQVTAAHELDDIVTISDMSPVEMFFEYLARKRMMIVKASLAARMIDDEVDRELLDA